MSSAVIPFEQVATTTAEELIIKDGEALANIYCLEPAAAHGLLGLVNLGDTFLAVFFRWSPRPKSELALGAGRSLHQNSIVREKLPVIAVMLPRSAAPEGSAWDLCLRAQPVQNDDAVQATLN